MPSDAFNQAAESVQSLTVKPTDDELLSLYGLFKQATVGDNTTPKPSVFDLKGKYKWNAWDKLKGKSQEDAEKEYIELAESLVAKYSN
ncbi:acyl-CoA-binding protein [Dipodascopsis tothii]|uniref:acyl-CoA-binding protein n=1 Tax=Dipodascopsis tothii TaxID=44089 RepID=UPI0034CDC699